MIYLLIDGLQFYISYSTIDSTYDSLKCKIENNSIFIKLYATILRNEENYEVDNLHYKTSMHHLLALMETLSYFYIYIKKYNIFY